jgi:hypothetical protein
MTNNREASFTLWEHYRLTYADGTKKICSDSCPSHLKYFDYSTGPTSAPFSCVSKCSYTVGASRDLDDAILKEILITFKYGTPKLACVNNCVDTTSSDNVFATSLPNHKLVTQVDHLSADFVHYKCVDRCNKSGVTVPALENKTENTDYYWFNLDGRCVEECPVYTNNGSGENVCATSCPNYVDKPVLNNLSKEVYYCTATCNGEFMFTNENSHLQCTENCTSTTLSALKFSTGKSAYSYKHLTQTDDASGSFKINKCLPVCPSGMIFEDSPVTQLCVVKCDKNGRYSFRTKDIADIRGVKCVQDCAANGRDSQRMYYDYDD